MIKLTLISLLFPLVALGQDMSGSIGVVTISDYYDDSDHKLEFLNEDGTVWYTLDLYKDWENKDDFKIIAFKPDYFLFHVRCKEKIEKGFKVVVNEGVGTTKFLRDSKKVKFLTWDEYVIDVFSVDFDRGSTVIYDQVEGTAIKVYPKNQSIIVPKEVKGDWMRVIWSDTEDYPSETSNSKTGWIKWRKNDRIMVTLYHLS